MVVLLNIRFNCSHLEENLLTQVRAFTIYLLHV